MVLLAEDDSDIRLLWRLAFQNAGFIVLEAADGLDAISMVQVEHLDAVVMDINMPRLDGNSALESIRLLRQGRNVPVIIVSAQNNPEVERRAIEAGAAEFLHKPLSPDTVIQAVRRHAAPTPS